MTTTKQIVKFAMSIALRDVQKPKCVRQGLVHKTKTTLK